MQHLAHNHSQTHSPELLPLVGTDSGQRIPPGSSDEPVGLCVYIFAKVTLRPPSQGTHKNQQLPHVVIRNRLMAWKNGRISDLWYEAFPPTKARSIETHPLPDHRRRALGLCQEGRYGKAVQALASLGTASPDDPKALKEIIDHHPVSKLPDTRSIHPSHLSVVCEQVKAVILRFPKGSGSQLRAQHLFDAICGTTTPAANDCLLELTKWINALLSGSANPAIAPWLCGARAPITALNKKGGGVRPIAVGETIWRLVCQLSCSFVHPSLPDVFLPEGQVGVGITGGAEAAIHATRQFIRHHSHLEDLCLLKVGFQNAFNECSWDTFLNRLEKEFPELFSWAHWCYSIPARLHFGADTILSTSGVQQGNPLGPLLPRSLVAQILEHIETNGHQFGLFLNKRKCEIYWPSGNQDFPQFPDELIRLKEGVSLLGSPIWGTTEYMKASITSLIDKAIVAQSNILELDNPQLELHLLRSCMGICKINHLLQTGLSYSINGSTIPSSNYHKDLGVIFTDTLSWSPHVLHVTSKAYKVLGLLKRALSSNGPGMKRTLYLTLVRSHLIYCSPVWRPYLVKDSAALEKLQRRATKFILGYPQEMDNKNRLMNLQSLCSWKCKIYFSSLSF